MRIRPLAALAALAALFAASAALPAFAQDARYLAANCANCHGTEGRSVGAIPALAGIDADYFIAQMKAFKDGRRQATIMNQLAKGYSDQQVATLAQFFSKQKAAGR